jgi:magnesium transporter
MKRDAHKLLLHSVRKLIRAGREQELVRVVDRSHPADLAYCFNRLAPADRNALFEAVTEDARAAEMLSELDDPVLVDFLENVADDRLTALLRAMASDDAADVLLHLDDARKDRILGQMETEEQSQATSLIGYDPETAGGLMSTDTFSMTDTTPAGVAVTRLQESDGPEVIFYIYVVNEHGQLVGVTSLRELVRQTPETTLGDFMITEVIRVNTNTDQEEVARLVARYNLLALPVVESNNQLVGVVTVDDIIDVIRLEATEDMMLMAGAGETDVSAASSPLSSIRARIPWLLPAFVAGALGIFVVQGFQADLQRFVPLAALIPIIMGMAGNVGIQSSTVVTRGLSIGRLDVAALSRMVFRETFVGGAAGLVYGLAVAGLVAVVFRNHAAIADPGVLRFSAMAAAAMVASMLMAAALGSAVPMVFARVGIDPARATGPFVTTSIDVTAVGLFLTIASVLL